MRAPPGRVFVLHLRAPPEMEDPIRQLRWLMKRLLRAYKFKCVSISELRPKRSFADPVK